MRSNKYIYLNQLLLIREIAAGIAKMTHQKEINFSNSMILCEIDQLKDYIDEYEPSEDIDIQWPENAYRDSL